MSEDDENGCDLIIKLKEKAFCLFLFRSLIACFSSILFNVTSLTRAKLSPYLGKRFFERKEEGEREKNKNLTSSEERLIEMPNSSINVNRGRTMQEKKKFMMVVVVA